jgi:hypothetical protein
VKHLIQVLALLLLVAGFVLPATALAEPLANSSIHAQAEISGEGVVTTFSDGRGHADVQLEGRLLGEASENPRGSFRGQGRMRFVVVSHDGQTAELQTQIEFTGFLSTPDGPVPFRGLWRGITVATIDPEDTITFGPVTGQVLIDIVSVG